MRLAVFADLHLDVPFRWAEPRVAQRRRQSLRDTLGEIIRVSAMEDVDAVLCAGDLYEHDCFSSDTGDFIRGTFEELAPVPVLLAPGNHDWLGPASLYSQVDWPANVHCFTDDRLRPYELTDGLTVWGAAHRAPANTDNFLDGFEVDRGGVNIALFHGSERGGLAFQEQGKQPHATFDAAQIPEAGLAHAFCGHFHSPKDAVYYTYPGNPDPLTFGETGERGVVIATVSEDGTVSRKRLIVAQSVVGDATVSITGCSNEQAVREIIRETLRERQGCVRLTLTGELAPDLVLHLNDLNAVAPELDALVIVTDEVRTGYDLDVIADEPTIRGQFVRDVLGCSDLDEYERHRVLQTGLRALEGRTDLEVI